MQVKITGDSKAPQIETVSQNVSIGGILLEGISNIPIEAPVSFVMTIEDSRMIRPICLTGRGRVVRSEPNSSGTGHLTAVECRTPIVQLESLCAIAV